MKPIFTNILLFALLLLLPACSGQKKPGANPEPVDNNNGAIAVEDDVLPPTDTPMASPDLLEMDKTERIQSLIDSMTLEEKLGQLFILDFRTGSSGPLEQINQSTIDAIHKARPGGIILFAENFSDLEQTKQLIWDFKDVHSQVSNIPLFIAVDEEGGIVSRVNKSAINAQVKPSAAAIGDTKNESLAQEVGQIIGEQLAALEINMNFAPCADLSDNPRNTVIGSRAFASDKDLAGKMVAATVIGIESTGVSAVIKHFPGHGQTENDTHDGRVLSYKEPGSLYENEYIPFTAGISAGCSGIMSSHITLTALDNLPASLSPEINRIIREELHYDGVIITDSFKMKAITNFYTPGDAAVLAIKAGADIILMPEDWEQAYNALLLALRKGEISEERIDMSLKRILSLKYEQDLFNEKKVSIEEADAILQSERHKEILGSFR